MPAETVFDALVRKFHLEPPELTKSPLRLYVDQLKRFIGPADQPGAEPDTFYSFHTVIQRAQSAADQDENRKLGPLQPIREAMSQANYLDVIRLANKIDLAKLQATEGLELAQKLLDACAPLKDGSTERADGLAAAVRIGEWLLAKDPKNLILIGNVAKALSLQSREGAVTADYDTSLRIADEVIERFSKESDEYVGEYIARALAAKSYSFSALKKFPESIAASNKLIDRFGQDVRPSLREKVAVAMRNKGVVLGQSVEEPDRRPEAIAIYDELIARFGDDALPAIREHVAMAMRNKGVLLGELDRRPEAIDVYDAMIRRFADDAHPTLREQVVVALVNKAFDLGKIDRKPEAVNVYGELIDRFADDTQPFIREQVARAMRNRIVNLVELDRRPEATAVYSQMMARFADDSQPSVAEHVDVIRQFWETLLESPKQPLDDPAS